MISFDHFDFIQPGMKKIFFLFISLILFVTTHDLSAQSHGHSGTIPAMHHTYHHDNIEVFTGNTSFPEHQTSHFTIGLDYEHRFNFWHHHLAVGVLMDYEMPTAEEQGEFIVVPTLMYYPFRRAFKVFTGGGMAFVDRSQYAVFRSGAAYEIELGSHLLIAPTMGMDYSGKTHWFYGLCTGWGF